MKNFYFLFAVAMMLVSCNMPLSEKKAQEVKPFLTEFAIVTYCGVETMSYEELDSLHQSIMGCEYYDASPMTYAKNYVLTLFRYYVESDDLKTIWDDKMNRSREDVDNYFNTCVPDGLKRTDQFYSHYINFVHRFLLRAQDRYEHLPSISFTPIIFCYKEDGIKTYSTVWLETGDSFEVNYSKGDFLSCGYNGNIGEFYRY